jgi:hypothetical protein
MIDETLVPENGPQPVTALPSVNVRSVGHRLCHQLDPFCCLFGVLGEQPERLRRIKRS